jgi:hypothetical protein
MKYPASHLTPFPPTFPRKIVCKRIENARNYARAPAIPLSTFKINTCKSVSKQRTLTPSRMNTYKKQGEGPPAPTQMVGPCPDSVGASLRYQFGPYSFQSREPLVSRSLPAIGSRIRGGPSSLLTVDCQLSTVDLHNHAPHQRGKAAYAKIASSDADP